MPPIARFFYKNRNMSEFTNKHEQRVEKLTNYILELIAGEKGSYLLKKYQILDISFIPLDVIMALDRVMDHDIGMPELKTASNKLFNILFKNLSSSVFVGSV